MKSIKKLTNKAKVVAGSALLVGATLTGAAGLAAAQSSGSNGTTLADYPQPFVSEDGQVQSTVVVGEDATTIDVVGGINIAGSLSQAAMTKETKTVSAETSGSAGWSASNGVTLDTVSEKIFMGDTADKVKSALDDQDLPNVLAEGQVEDYSYNQYLKIGGMNVEYGAPGDRDDPVNYLGYANSANNFYTAQVSFEDPMEEQDVAGEQITLFGQEFTISSTSSDFEENKLVLYGSGQDVTLGIGPDATQSSSKTVKIDGEEVTFKLDSISDNDNSDEATLVVNGETEDNLEDGDSFDVGDSTVYVEDVSVSGVSKSGTVRISVGSSKVTLENGQEVMRGTNDEEIDGTNVQIQGTEASSNGNDNDKISDIKVDVSAADSDNAHLAAGEKFEDPVFGGFSLKFGGLNPDAQEDGESVTDVELTASSDEATLSLTDADGNSVSQVIAKGSNPALADGESDGFVTVEGAPLQEDQYTVVQEASSSAILEVTNIDDSASNNQTDVEIENVNTGTSYDVTLEDSATTPGASGAEDIVINGQAYTVYVGSNGDSTDNSGDTVKITDGDSATDVFAGVETQAGATVHLTEAGATAPGMSDGDTLNLPTGTVTLNSTSTSGDQVQDDGIVSTDLSGDTAIQDAEKVGGVWYNFAEVGSDNDAVTVSVDADQSATGSNAGPGVLVQEEAGDDNTRDEYFVSAGQDDNDDIVLGAATGESGSTAGGTFFSTAPAAQFSLENYDTDNQKSDVSMFGTFVKEANNDEQGEYTFSIPSTQSVAGVGVVAEGGNLSSTGGSASVKYTESKPAGWPDSAALDSEITGSAKNQNLVLVGGPAVNSLTKELAQSNKTMKGSEYSQGQSVIDLVEGGFDGQHDALVVAGYSGEDTRAAANFLANYMDHEDRMTGSKVELTTQKITQ